MSEIRVNNIIDEAGTGAPTFPNGATGNLTGNVTGNVTGTATTATALSGTPNITVGTVTGTDATFSGNLTVQGTTTTIDTAVTAVDSLIVDGNVGIGTTIPNNYGNYNTLTINGNSGGELDFERQGVLHADIFANDSAYYITTRVNNLPIVFSTTNGGGTHAERVRIDGNGTTKFSGPLTEKCNRDTGAGLSGNYNHDLISHGNVHWATSNSVSTWTYNLRGSATVALNDMMTAGETLSFQLITGQNNASYYMTEFRIDGTAHTVWWQGGSAPSEGGAGGYDVYTFTVFKIGNASFRTFASLSNHA